VALPQRILTAFPFGFEFRIVLQKTKTPRNHTYLIDLLRLVVEYSDVNLLQMLRTEHLHTHASFRRHLNTVLDFITQQTGNHLTVNRVNKIVINRCSTILAVRNPNL
jgi:hypothetical protein